MNKAADCYLLSFDWHYIVIISHFTVVTVEVSNLFELVEVVNIALVAVGVILLVALLAGAFYCCRRAL